MTDSDELFADTAPDDSVFTEKGALDPLTSPDDNWYWADMCEGAISQ